MVNFHNPKDMPGDMPGVRTLLSPEDANTKKQLIIFTFFYALCQSMAFLLWINVRITKLFIPHEKKHKNNFIYFQLSSFFELNYQVSIFRYSCLITSLVKKGTPWKIDDFSVIVKSKSKYFCSKNKYNRNRRKLFQSM